MVEWTSLPTASPSSGKISPLWKGLCQNGMDEQYQSAPFNNYNFETLFQEIF